MGVKTCKTCKEEKPLTEYYKDKRNKDGLRNECSKCVRIRSSRNKRKIPKYDKPDRTYKCLDCKEELPITEYTRYPNGNRQRRCNECREIISNFSAFDTWLTLNKHKPYVKLFRMNLKRVFPNIEDPDWLLKKYRKDGQ